MGLNVGIVVAEGGIVLMTVMVRSSSGVVVVVVGVGIVVAIMDVKLELVVLVVAFDVGIVVAEGGMVLVTVLVGSLS